MAEVNEAKVRRFPCDFAFGGLQKVRRLRQLLTSDAQPFRLKPLQCLKYATHA
jgi:hypothetical protein